MAAIVTVIAAPATGAVAMYALVTELLALGWTKASDSDGTTYSASGVQVTSGGSGANGLGNTNAWIRLVAPSPSFREYTIQRGTNNTAYRIKHSPADGFIGGSPGAARTPSATDEVVLCGSGSDAAPAADAVLPYDATYRAHVIVDDAAFLPFAMNTYLLDSIGPSASNWISFPETSLEFIAPGSFTPTALTASMIGNGTPPVVTITQPAVGAVVHRHDSLMFTVETVDLGAEFVSIVVGIRFTSNIWELVSVDGVFSLLYTGSSRTGGTDTFSYTIVRPSGWPQTPTLEIVAVDNGGNVNA